MSAIFSFWSASLFTRRYKCFAEDSFWLFHRKMWFFHSNFLASTFYPISRVHSSRLFFGEKLSLWGLAHLIFSKHSFFILWGIVKGCAVWHSSFLGTWKPKLKSLLKMCLYVVRDSGFGVSFTYMSYIFVTLRLQERYWHQWHDVCRTRTVVRRDNFEFLDVGPDTIKFSLFAFVMCLMDALSHLVQN